MPGKKRTEITSKLIESYRNDLYEENLYIIKETIYKDGFIRELKNEQSPFKEDAMLKDCINHKYVTSEELEVHLNRCFCDCNICVNCDYRKRSEYVIKICHGNEWTQFNCNYRYVIYRDNWKYVRSYIRNLLNIGLESNIFNLL